MAARTEAQLSAATDDFSLHAHQLGQALRERGYIPVAARALYAGTAGSLLPTRDVKAITPLLIRALFIDFPGTSGETRRESGSNNVHNVPTISLIQTLSGAARV